MFGKSKTNNYHTDGKEVEIYIQNAEPTVLKAINKETAI